MIILHLLVFAIGSFTTHSYCAEQSPLPDISKLKPPTFAGATRAAFLLHTEETGAMPALAQQHRHPQQRQQPAVQRRHMRQPHRAPNATAPTTTINISLQTGRR